MLNAVDDFAHLTKGQWVADDETNTLVNDLIHNYKIKLNDLSNHRSYPSPCNIALAYVSNSRFSFLK